MDAVNLQRVLKAGVLEHRNVCLSFCSQTGFTFFWLADSRQPEYTPMLTSKSPLVHDLRGF